MDFQDLALILFYGKFVKIDSVGKLMIELEFLLYTYKGLDEVGQTAN